MNHDDKRLSWTHAMCEACWDSRNPEYRGRIATDAIQEECCYCGVVAPAVYFRVDPNDPDLRCRKKP